jgi:hypothetical protein
MNHSQGLSAVRWVTRFIPLAAVVAMLGMASSAWAQDIVRVEEDWELVLGTPDQLVCGPQILTTMSPYSHINDLYFTFEINHRSAPYWTAGGLSMHQWDGEWRTQSYDRTDRTLMSTDNEVVTWTQRMSVEKSLLGLSGNKLAYQVINGQSTTWGAFGTSGQFVVKGNWNKTHINDYSPAVSLAESAVTYAGNRVHSLKIKEIRLVLSDGEVLTDNTERTAHLLLE